MHHIKLTFAVFCLTITCINHHIDAQDKKAAVSGLVRTLGYGGAIHNFKNYVLRGDEKYQAAAESMFERASASLVALSKADDLSDDEKAAVEAISAVIKQYQGHLTVIEKLWKQGKSVEEIDETVAVDDSPAIDAIDTLRAGHQWNNIENLDFHIGYGSGIHNFKNFILRADEKYLVRARSGLSSVLLIVSQYRETKGLTKTQETSLGNIESVVRAYEQALPKVQDLVGKGKTAKEIDVVVKVNDKPAVDGLLTLRKQ